MDNKELSKELEKRTRKLAVRYYINFRHFSHFKLGCGFAPLSGALPHYEVIHVICRNYGGRFRYEVLALE